MTEEAVKPDQVAGIADQRRDQMLRAAIVVICERGFAETRIADVAERAGVSPALVIYYFKTKDQLLTEAMRFSEDTWYAYGQRRMESLPTAAQRLEEIVAMTCLPEADPQAHVSWLLWLDFWAQAARNPEVGRLRQTADERWRELIRSVVTAGQDAGEFRSVDASGFAVCLSSLLDGFAIQIALGDETVQPAVAYQLSMRFVADQLAFDVFSDGGKRVVIGKSTGR
jgi:AcrR family transcriptional regulator